jgi:uncharacterized repeat protein (TIGR03803 family)
MNYARQHDKPFRMVTAFVAAMVVLTITGAAIPAQAQTYKVLYEFPINGPDPQWPGGPLAQGRDGDLYGWSYEGGTNNDGSMWKTTLSGSVHVVYSFNATNGPDCQNGMTLGTDGNFYGTALTSCTGDGYVFKLTPSGTLTVLHTFTGTPDGSGSGQLVQYTDGNFYGVTTKGGANNYGAVFKITPTGKLTILYSFDNTDNFYNPNYGLTVGADGNFYGTTGSNSGAGYPGTVFKITPAGVATVLHTFTSNPDGAAPVSGVILGKDGNFYGDTEQGGAYGYGTLFKMTPSGKLTILYSFNSGTDYATNPTAPLLQATDGNFYGVLISRFQDLFRFTPSGTLTVLEKFILPGGVLPYWPLIQDTNGILYGLLQQGGTVNGGELFSLKIGAKPFVSLVSTSGKEGANIGILGQSFSSSSVVEFGGVQATSIKLTGKTFISATVPTGALTGSVTVTTGSTILTSIQTFKVKPTLASFKPSSGPVGTPVMIMGTGLTQTTKVTFGGVAATTFKVNTDSQVMANVPTGAVTGKIVIKTKGGSAASKTDFTVTQ